MSPCILVILDGWGIAKNPSLSAIENAHTPYIDHLYKKYPNTTLQASGRAVGLPQGQIGNSEVGHIHIGSGRVIHQDLLRINTAIKNKKFYTLPTLLHAIYQAKNTKKSLHFIGLVSNGGVHAHLNHLKELCLLAYKHGLKNVFIHAFTDGRDTSPLTAIKFLHELENYLQKTTGKIATIIGRYYAMDRDQRWERTKIAYDALVHSKGKKTKEWQSSIQEYYNQGITDEFFLPLILTNHNQQPIAKIQNQDIVISFNFRNDRVKQITSALIHQVYPTYNMQPLSLEYYTFTPYDKRFNAKIIFKKKIIKNTLGSILSENNKKQFRIAETEKYPHVTYFFSGGRVNPFPGEDRYLCPSPKVATYNLQPAMSAHAITAKTLKVLHQQYYDFILVNFANPDMVGHTGNWQATLKACEIVDQCVEKIVAMAQKKGYVILIIADHGNAEEMMYPDNTIHTAHTDNEVPCILVMETKKKILQGNLTHIAPTILQLMQCPKPQCMETGLLK